MSSVKGDPEVLQSLHDAMRSFYAEDVEREPDQEMLDDIEEEPDEDSSTTHLVQYVTRQRPESLLEIGCGNGRLFRTLRKCGCGASYIGGEVATYVI
jgi:tRNA G46 methylase TrmB